MADNPLKTPEAIVESSPLEILVTNPEEVAIETEDGGLLIDFDPDAVDFTDDFNDNLAEFMEDSSLDELASELVSNYLSDKESRSDWEETYVKGLDQLGLKINWRRSSGSRPGAISRWPFSSSSRGCSRSRRTCTKPPTWMALRRSRSSGR